MGKDKKCYLFFSIIFFIGIILGIIFVCFLNEDSKEIIFLNINELIKDIENIRVNNILIHLIVISVILLLSIFIIGIPLNIFFIFYNGFSIGFSIISLIYIFGIKGLFFGLIYNIISKLLFIIIYLIISVKLIKVIKLIIKRIVLKEKDNNIYIYLKRIIILVLIIFINDIILYFGSNYLINVFKFLVI